MKNWIIIGLVILLIVLQYKLWVGKGSMAEVVSLRQDVMLKQQELEKLKQRNLQLQAEVESLKNDLGAIEESARSDLGMIKQGEIYFQMPEDPE